MSHFKVKMHQIQFRLGLCPRHRWGSLHRSPDPLAEFKGPTSKGRDRTGGEGRAGKGKGGEVEGPLVLAYTPDVKSWIKRCLGVLSV